MTDADINSKRADGTGSVAHRAELEAFHSRKITLERREGGAKLVSDIHLIPRKARSGSLLRRMVKRR